MAGQQSYTTGYVGTTNSYATGNVNGINRVGGLVGLLGYFGAEYRVLRSKYFFITNSYATGNVRGNENLGGLVGEQGGGSITYSYAKGHVSGNNNLGGFVGESYDTITDSYSRGNVSILNGTPDSYAGGFAGYIQLSTNGRTSGPIERCYSTARIEGAGTYGGFAGNLESARNISNLFLE